MRTFRVTETDAERIERIRRATDIAYQGRIDSIRRYRERGYGVTYVIWDYSDAWHPEVVATFDNIVAAQEVASRNDAYDWEPTPTYATPEQYDADDPSEKL